MVGLREDWSTEFKLKYTDEIKKTIIAFANTDGGNLYIGIADDGQVVGVTDADDTLLRLTGTIRDAIKPDVTLFAVCDLTEMEGKTIVKASVSRGTARPYYLAGKGIRPEGVFVRQGASTVPASAAAILAMIKETSGDSFEEQLSVEQDLTFAAAERFFAEKNMAFDEPRKRTLRLVNDDGLYTNLALLLSDQCVHTVKLAIFEGSDKTVFKDRFETGGSLLKQAEDAYAYIDKYNRTRAEIHGLGRVDYRDYPVEAIREALLNAIVHRDYSYSASTLISLFDERLEFVSIGGLAKGLSLSDILLGVSQSRNKYLADIFFRLNIVEAYGTGIAKINRAYSGFPAQPEITASDNAFKTVLPNMNFWREAAARQSAVNRESGSGFAAPEGNRAEIKKPPAENADSRREQAIIALLKAQGEAGSLEIKDRLSVSRSTALIILKSMVERGLLQREQRGRSVLYKIVSVR